MYNNNNKDYFNYFSTGATAYSSVRGSVWSEKKEYVQTNRRKIID